VTKICIFLCELAKVLMCSLSLLCDHTFHLHTCFNPQDFSNMNFRVVTQQPNYILIRIETTPRDMITKLMYHSSHDLVMIAVHVIVSPLSCFAGRLCFVVSNCCIKDVKC